MNVKKCQAVLCPQRNTGIYGINFKEKEMDIALVKNIKNEGSCHAAGH